MEKFKGKYRNETARAQWWNYADSACYYVTICTAGRQHFFGDIVKTESGQIMELSAIGNIVREEWLKTVMRRPDLNLYLDEFIVMPDHIHLIIEIGHNKSNSNFHVIGTTVKSCGEPDLERIRIPGNRFSPQSNNLAAIIRGFKGAVTSRVQKSIHATFGWQPRYYDRIIRNSAELNNIRQYILDNPAKWKAD